MIRQLHSCSLIAVCPGSLVNNIGGTDLTKPYSVSDVFDSLLEGISKDFKSLVLLGVTAIGQSIWLCRNDMTFEKEKISFVC